MVLRGRAVRWAYDGCDVGWVSCDVCGEREPTAKPHRNSMRMPAATAAVAAARKKLSRQAPAAAKVNRATLPDGGFSGLNHLSLQDISPFRAADAQLAVAADAEGPSEGRPHTPSRLQWPSPTEPELPCSRHWLTRHRDLQALAGRALHSPTPTPRIISCWTAEGLRAPPRPRRSVSSEEYVDVPRPRRAVSS